MGAIEDFLELIVSPLSLLWSWNNNNNKFKNKPINQTFPQNRIFLQDLKDNEKEKKKTWYGRNYPNYMDKKIFNFDKYQKIKWDYKKEKSLKDILKIK